jgi:mannose-6-phosphate isomerase-like protein (cupin superfamily)
MKNLTRLIMTVRKFLQRRLIYALAVACVLMGSAFVQGAEQSQTPTGSSTGSGVSPPPISPTGSGIKKESGQGTIGPMFVKFKDVNWEKAMPELGNNSPEIAILHVDPKTKATQLMIRVPKNFHVPRHWHTANETHTIINGTFIMECEGKRAELGPGSFNYIPSKMIHQAWTKPNEGTLLFITTDGAWDVNWVDGPPKALKKK